MRFALPKNEVLKSHYSTFLSRIPTDIGGRPAATAFSEEELADVEKSLRALTDEARAPALLARNQQFAPELQRTKSLKRLKSSMSILS